MPAGKEEVETTITFVIRGSHRKRDYGLILRDCYEIFRDYTAEVSLASGKGGPKLTIRGFLTESVPRGIATLKAGLDGGRYFVGEEKATNEPTRG